MKNLLAYYLEEDNMKRQLNELGGWRERDIEGTAAPWRKYS